MATARTATKAPRKKRANGEASRQKILEAATEIAAERGYEGTSIAGVSERSGLPASSIYWHFKDKDALIAAVIEQSFGEWLVGMSGWSPALEDLSPSEKIAAMARRTADALLTSGDFLRLGLLLALERRPEEPSARRMFLRVREEARRCTAASYGELFPHLGEDAVRQLASFAMAMADGLFVAHEIDRDGRALLECFEMVAAAVLGAATHLDTRSDRSMKEPSRPCH